jgi:hypothetical protein
LVIEPKLGGDVRGGEVVGVSAGGAEWAAYEEDDCGQWHCEPEKEGESLVGSLVVWCGLDFSFSALLESLRYRAGERVRCKRKRLPVIAGSRSILILLIRTSMAMLTNLE